MKWLCDGQEDCKMGEDEKNCQETGEETSHRTLTHRAVLLCAASVVHNIVCIASVKNSIYSDYSFVGQRNIFFLSTVSSACTLCEVTAVSDQPQSHRSTCDKLSRSSEHLPVTLFSSAVVPSCSVNEYVCTSGGCVSASLRCDGHDNCLDGSDEVRESPLNCRNIVLQY